MDDDEIVSLYLKRDESAIKETKQKYGRYLFKIAHNILNNIEDSEESVNDTYLKTWTSIPPHQPKNLSTYLGKITRQLSIDIYRTRKREKRKSSEYAISLTELEECISNQHNTTKESVDYYVLSEAINTYLYSLSKEERILFVGRYYYVDSIKDIANYCYMSESKVKTKLYRIRQGLKQYLNKEGFDV